MRARNVGRLIFMLAVAAMVSVFAAACGGAGGGTSTGNLDASFDGTTNFGGGLGKNDGAATNSCAPKTCQSLGYTCGSNSDGCGNLIPSCGTCTAPDSCGVGGFSKCGNPTVGADGGALVCTPQTCVNLDYTCGENADGCGGMINCGSCTVGYCGGGGFSQCGTGPDASADAAPLCTPITCASLGNTCGAQGDGCGGLVGPCGTGACTLPQICGGGGVFNQCGGNFTDAGVAIVPDGGPSTCTPLTCAALAAQGVTSTCGPQGDGCGGLVGPCGTVTTCTSPAYCGGGGYNQCGTGPAGSADGGTASCTPITCATLAAKGITNTCGSQSDGCGGLVGPCGTQTTCTSPQYCGGGGFNQCGGNDGLGPDGGVICTPLTCASYSGYNCGQASDGCGSLTAPCGTLNGGCTTPEYCGGGGAYKCGGNVAADGGAISACVPATCASKGYNCGMAGDGCGGTIGPCGGTCPTGEVCGGSGVANVCGTTTTCTNTYCAHQVACDGGGTTSITGTVYAGIQVPGQTVWNPGSPDPVPGVLVYIPTTTLSSFDTNPNLPQISCVQCGADVSGDPLVSTTTAYNGTFTLPNVPVGIPFPLVIQLGKWRREFTINAIPTTSACTTVTASEQSDAGAAAGVFNMPSTEAEGNIPLTAISTGNWDAIECVLLKMGVAQSEFTSYATWHAVDAGATEKAGRIHIYTSTAAGESFNRGPGSTLAPQEDETVLMGSGATGGVNGTYMMYDQILLPCWGDEFTGARSAGELANLINYGTNGGHFFTTHYSYIWLHGNGAYNGIANWGIGDDTNVPEETPFTGTVSQSVPPPTPTPPGIFVEWLNFVGALNVNTAFPAAPPNPATVTLQQARHDVDSVAGTSTPWITSATDPNNGTGEMLLHFTFNTPVAATADAGVTQCGHGIFSDFHVTVSGAEPNAPTTFPNECTAADLTSQERILEYMIWDLSSCVPNTTSSCTPETCGQQGLNCGPASDTCGNLIDGGCGTCSNGQLCGGAGQANVCGLPDSGACTKLTCPGQGFNCGSAGDGCGGTLACGSCPTGQTCGGGGKAGVCGAPDAGCQPQTCLQQGIYCGPASDGCGNAITNGCGTCPAGQTCGGGGVAGVCGSPDAGACTPLTCAEQNIECGSAGDGCGNVIDGGCGSCPTGQTCGGGGVPSQCAAVPDAGTMGCVPESCAQQGIQCGPTGDGCGNVITSCGTCTAPQVCGGCGMPGVCCGTSNCAPVSCTAQNIFCGPAGDGCGNLIQCGECDSGTCGGGGVNGVCGGGSMCVPATCAQQGISCGPAGDGCGGTIASCGTCASPLTCGGGGTPGVCGQQTVTAQ
jgi:hypothetical protein